MSQGNLLANLKHFLAAYPKQPILIAYSGGVDSQVLLHSLATLKQQAFIQNTLHVCHVNHGLSDNAQHWQNFAKQQCAQQGVELTCCELGLKREKGQSLEAQARKARYQALVETANKLSLTQALIMTGHHQDDQCETFLLALKRGAGLKGLSAMTLTSPLTGYGNGEHILARPLLSCSRQDIVEYAQNQQLTWVEDESNLDTTFDRNFLRQTILPQLTQRWHSFATTVSRSAEHCQQGQELLDEMAAEDLSRCLLSSDHKLTNKVTNKMICKKASSKVINIAQLTQLSQARQYNLLRFFIAQCGGFNMPSKEQLAQVIQQITTAANDKSPVINLGDYCLRRYQQGLYITANFAEVSHFSKELTLTSLREKSFQAIVLPDGLGQLQLSLTDTDPKLTSSNEETFYLRLPEQAQKVTIAFSHNNPRCLPEHRQKSRPLKKVLQELQIAPWQRKRIPFITIDGVLAAGLAHFVCQEFSVNKLSELDEKKQPMLMIHWLKE